MSHIRHEVRYRRPAFRYAIVAAALLLCGSAHGDATSCKEKCAALEDDCHKRPLDRKDRVLFCNWFLKNCHERKGACDAKYQGCLHGPFKGVLPYSACIVVHIDCQDKCPH